MPKTCCVPKCHSRGDREIGISFFHFPTDPQIRKEWIYMIRRNPGKDFNLGKHTLVCSLHFKEDDMVVRSGDCLTKRLLHTGAVPSVFPFHPSEHVSKKVHKYKKKKQLPTPTGTKSVPTRAIVGKSQVQDDHAYCTESLTEEETQSALQEARQQVEELKAEVQMLMKCRFLSIDTMCNNDNYIRHLTGFKSFRKLETFFNLLEPYMEKGNTSYKRTAMAFSAKNEFFLTMTRLRRGWSEKDLAVFFNVSVSTANSIFITWLNLLHVTLESLLTWTSKGNAASRTPDSFKPKSPNMYVIIDTTKICVERAPSLVHQSAMFSNNKNHNTYKYLVGISPDQSVTFVSELYEDSVSDEELVQNSGFLDLVEPGDEEMTDKGFKMSAEPKSKGPSLAVIPMKTSAVRRKKNRVAHKTQDIASAPECVKSVLSQINCFKIFEGTVPLSLADCVSQMWVVCGLLINFL